MIANMAEPQQEKSRDLLADLERHTELLEAQVAKLTKNYDHWRLLEAEYEALGDEVHQARTRFPNASSDAAEEKSQKAELVRMRRDFDGQLVDHATVCELFGARLGQTITRSIDSIASAIGRRLDYVQQNTATLKRQVEEAANKLAAAQVVSRPGMPALSGVTGNGESDDAGEDSGFEGAADDSYGPVTDIMEELDEDGNVVSFQLQTPSNTQTQVLDALKKAGVDEIPAGGPSQATLKDNESPRKSEEEPAAAKNETAKTADTASTPKETLPTRKPSMTPKPRRSVSFADDTKPDADAEGSSSPPPETFAAQRLGKIIQSAKDQEALVGAGAVIPENESEDEATLRREMLQYSMSEIGPIVAQLDIEEGLSDDEGFNDEDFDDDEYYDDDDNDDDDEDQFGRSKYSVIDEAYRERMLELEKKLGVKPMANQSIVPASKTAAPNVINREDIAESLGRIRVSAADMAASAAADQQAKAAPTSVLKEPTASFRAKAKAVSGEGKKVSFATDLDIAHPKEEVRAPVAPALKSEPEEPFVDPLSDVIERRSAPKSFAATGPGSEQKPKRVSRFKMARGEGSGAPEAAAPAALAVPSAPTLPKGPHQAPVRFLDEDRIVAPSGPEGKTHSEDVFERQAVTEPKEPHELDAHLVFQETATEYHRTRNRLIQQEGGYMKASESAVVPVGQEDGGPRISKFKAARVGQQFMNP
ncbi:hypothetical protein F503_05326 [Ophiostoma piceae UAMH 11346]|uniref:DUF3835 domain-containing protein n=1 Tax=Ophiostoma piceae (strain UAMH 11346) TaxID=1262450 RepID=S3CDY1_OPHP1|nr:hypothetical protein F503_05326 [Ophiostoma piceae UAMH 11346]